MRDENLNETILHAVETIRDEDENLRGDLDALLAEAGETPEERCRAANRALALLIRHPQAWKQLREQLPPDTLGDEDFAIRFWKRLPGGEAEVPAGSLMVCPEDPPHYRKRLHQRGQVLICPQHGVRLVPLADV
jgi:hypothetical protein